MVCLHQLGKILTSTTKLWELLNGETFPKNFNYGVTTRDSKPRKIHKGRGGRGMRQKIRDKSKNQTHEKICTYSQNVLSTWIRQQKHPGTGTHTNIPRKRGRKLYYIQIQIKSIRYKSDTGRSGSSFIMSLYLKFLKCYYKTCLTPSLPGVLTSHLKIHFISSGHVVEWRVLCTTRNLLLLAPNLPPQRR